MRIKPDANAAKPRDGDRLIQIKRARVPAAIIGSFAAIRLRPTNMPYANNTELPTAVRNHLPPHAQDIFRETFDAAWARYGGHPRREEIAFRVAWSAVKKSYVKVGTAWIARADPAPARSGASERRAAGGR